MKEKPNEGRLPAVNPEKCDGCGRCASACPTGAVRVPNAGSCAKCVKYCLSLDVPCSRESQPFAYETCDACGRCIEACLTGALFWTGREAALARQPLARPRGPAEP
ncbi:MAG TPA: 4Fe-4S binding protein [Myxococcales bacterium]